MSQIYDYLIMAPPILLALTFHEFSHGYIANRLGDPTAKLMGRLTMNPLVHLDLLGTAMLFIVGIGWARPVPVNPYNFKNPHRDLLWVSLAGPLSNLILAFIFGLGMRLIRFVDPAVEATFLIQMIWYGVTINVVLAFFNLLPIPPLDGSKILMGLVSNKYQERLQPLLKFGPPILIAIIVFGFITKRSILWNMIEPLVNFFTRLFAGIG